jgi:two-component system sensor histidine kinase MprB
MSLRLRIALLLAVLAAAATVAVGVISFRTTSVRLLSAVDDSLVEASAIAQARRFDDRLFESGPFSEIAVQAVLADGTVLRSTFPRAFEALPAELGLIGRRGVTTFRTVNLGRDDYRVRSIGFDDGIVQVGRSLHETDDVLESLRTRTIALVAAVTVIAAGLGALTAGRITRSLRRLTSTAEHVEATGNLDVDLPEGTSGRDEVGRLTEAFRLMLLALDRSRADQTRLVQDAGHELRTPLTSIRTNLDMLDRYPDIDPAERAEILDSIRAEAAELTTLVNEVVQVASGESDDDDPVEVLIADVVSEVAERVTRRTGRAVEVSADRSRVLARRASLARAISNLIDNAVKFDDGDRPIEVTVESGRIAVADRGPGVADSDKPLIFERFHRADAARTLPGSGLGLAIVAEVARAHGGTVFAGDRDGGGAVIGMEFPVVAEWPAPQ